MPLITCPNCQSRVIDTAACCPNCGEYLENGGSMSLSCNCTHPSTVEIKPEDGLFARLFRKKKNKSGTA